MEEEALMDREMLPPVNECSRLTTSSCVSIRLHTINCIFPLVLCSKNSFLHPTGRGREEVVHGHKPIQRIEIR